MIGASTPSLGSVSPAAQAPEESPKAPRLSRFRARVGRPAIEVRESASGARDALVDSVSVLYDRALDRVLATPSRVTSAAEAGAMLASNERSEALSDHVQKVTIAALPVIRLTARGARFTRTPWVFVASTVFSLGSTVHTGVRETQMLGSLVAHRLEQATGRPAEPALVKKLTVELYLAPRRDPDLSDRRLHLGRLARRWIIRGTLGRDTGKATMKALDAAERLDLAPHIASWNALPPGRRLKSSARRGASNL